MLRKFIQSAIVATATLTGFGAVPLAQANPPGQADHYYEVLMQRGDEGWQLHGTYRVHAEARSEAIRLWREGYRVVICEF